MSADKCVGGSGGQLREVKQTWIAVEKKEKSTRADSDGNKRQRWQVLFCASSSSSALPSSSAASNCFTHGAIVAMDMSNGSPALLDGAQ